MEKSRVENPKVRCGTCRKFDGYTWCRHWNHFTTPDSPPCAFYTRGSDRPLELVDSRDYLPEGSVSPRS